MPVRRIDKAQWRDFLVGVTQDLVGAHAETEVAGLVLGRRIDVEWLGLFGLNYEPRADAIEVALDGLDHLVHAPRELWADLDESGLKVLEIVGADGTRQVIRLREPLPVASTEPARAASR